MSVASGAVVGVVCFRLSPARAVHPRPGAHHLQDDPAPEGIHQLRTWTWAKTLEQVNRDVMTWADSQIDEITTLREADTFRKSSSAT